MINCFLLFQIMAAASKMCLKFCQKQKYFVSSFVIFTTMFYFNMNSVGNKINILNADQPSFYPLMTLFNISDFRYINNNPDVCSAAEPVLAVVIVFTHPSSFELRQAHRNHMPQDLLNRIGIRRVFLMGKATTHQIMYPIVADEIVTKENEIYKDIIQGNFVDHYRNLTYKQIMGFRWALQHCSRAKFLIKQDDDFAVNIFQIGKLLNCRYSEIKSEIYGFLRTGIEVQRTNFKWSATYEEYPNKTYPDYMLGASYFMDLEATRKIVHEYPRRRFFWLEDVYGTGIVAGSAGVARKNIEGFTNIYVSISEHCVTNEYSSDEYYCDSITTMTGFNSGLLNKTLDHFSECFKRKCKYTIDPKRSELYCLHTHRKIRVKWV